MLHIIESCYGTKEARQRGFVDLSYTTLQDNTGLARSSISRALDGLRSRGLINQTLHNVKVQRLSIAEPKIIASKGDSGSKKLPEVVAKSYPEVAKSYQSSYMNLKNQESKEDDDESSPVADFLVGLGLGRQEAVRLSIILNRNERDLSQVQELSGYVAQKARTNPLGLLIKMIEENQQPPNIVTKPRQDGPSATKKPKAGKSGAMAWLDRQKEKGQL